MKAVTELTEDERNALSKQHKELHEKLREYKYSELFKDYRRKFGYAHYTFSGYITDKFVEALGRMPTPNEIILLVDSGYSHFGATCTISGRYFSGKVYID